MPPASNSDCLPLEQPSIRIDLPDNTSNGATASSKGTRPVCRLPLSALLPSTRECHPWRPAAVLQYDTDTAMTIDPTGMFMEHPAGHQLHQTLDLINSLDWTMHHNLMPMESITPRPPTMSLHNMLMNSHIRSVKHVRVARLSVPQSEFFSSSDVAIR